jgi:ABC-2 type transport system permease protein
MTALDVSRFDASFRPTFGRALRSEWIKLRSLRSTLWATLLTIAIMAGFGMLYAMLVVTDPGGGPHRPMFLVLGYPFAQLTIGVLGALIVTGEYATGSIRTTFTADPNRLRVVGAKALLITIVATVIAAISITLGGIPSLAMFEGAGLELSTTPAELLGVAGAVVACLVMSALFAYGIALLVRNTAAALTTVVGVLFVLPIMVQLVAMFTGADWALAVFNHLPSVAGSQMMVGMEMGMGESALTAAQGAAWFAGYTLVALAAGTVATARREH